MYVYIYKLYIFVEGMHAYIYWFFFSKWKAQLIIQ